MAQENNTSVSKEMLWYVDNYIVLIDYYDRTVSRIAARCVRMGNIALEEYKYNVMLKDGAKKFIEKCKANGLKCTYATASADILCDTVLKANNVYEYFDSLYQQMDCD